MPPIEHFVRQIKEKMRMLKALIDDGKISREKRIELQLEYCFLQREHELITTKR